MNKETQHILKQAFQCPEPKKKNAFLSALRPRSITMLDFVIMQIAYIRKIVWLVMFSILGAAILCAWKDSGNIEKMMAAMIPFAAAVSMVETQRSSACQMTEIEAATRFSLRSIVFAKMLIMGIVFLGVFAVITPVIAIALNASLVQTATHILIPYLLTMAICLHIERSKIGRSNMYLSIVVASGVSISVLLAGSQTLMYINRISELLLIAITVFLMIATLLECKRTINKMEAFA